MVDEAPTLTSATVRAGQLTLDLGHGPGRVAASVLEFATVKGQAGLIGYTISDAHFEDVAIRIDRLHWTTSAASAAALTLDSSDGALNLRSNRFELPHGLSVTTAASGVDLRAPHLTIDDCVFTADFSPPPKEAPSAAETTTPSTARSRAETIPPEAAHAAFVAAPPPPPDPIDLHFLDSIRGHVNVDVVVDVTLPWIGRRRATHRLRVPIHDGTIDFEALENDVHWLEGSVLDFEVEGTRLVLFRRDLPLIPIGGKALMWWNFDEEDRALAKRRRVRLRNLFRPVFPRGNTVGDKKKKSKLTVHEISLRNIDVELSMQLPGTLELPHGGVIRFGAENQAGIADLKVAGDIVFGSDKPAIDTELRGRIGLMDVTTHGLKLGGIEITCDRLHLGAIDNLSLQFRGLHPVAVRAEINRVAGSNLRLGIGSHD